MAFSTTYTLDYLVKVYNAGDAQILSNTIMRYNGLLANLPYFEANKGIKHSYNIYNTLPTVGIGSIGDGVAASDTTGSATDISLTSFEGIHQVKLGYLTMNNTLAHYNVKAPQYFQAIANLALKSFIYGTNATYGTPSFLGTGFHTYLNTNTSQTVKQFQTTGSATNCTSIFALKLSPFPGMDGVQTVYNSAAGDGNYVGGLFYLSPNWDIPRTINGSTGNFEGYEMFFKLFATTVLPGTKNVSAIRGIQTNSTITTAMIDDMLDAVYANPADTIIVCNYRGRSMINALKPSVMYMDTANTSYNSMIGDWNGVKIVTTETILNTENGALYGLT